MNTCSGTLPFTMVKLQAAKWIIPHKNYQSGHRITNWYILYVGQSVNVLDHHNLDGVNFHIVTIGDTENACTLLHEYVHE